jgi:Cys-tRNA(Pro)/Cys-tRNA(Cys) deacylase
MQFCRDSVEDFITRHGINAIVREFSEGVETVEKASQLCGAKPDEIIKTLIVIVDGEPVAVIVPGNKRLNYKKLSMVLNARNIRMAKPEEVEKYTGFEVGAVSPLSECIKKFKIVMDREILSKTNIWCGGGEKNSLAFVKVKDLINLLSPMIADIST